jgi:arabinofuranan 3-O-arabinosyltransferase
MTSRATVVTRYRVRLSAVCLAIVAACFVQAPGRIVADTKLDLVTDPAAFLGRSLHLWDPLGYFGQLQNQAYGYLFPMGPFFLAGHLVQLDPWVVQRLWWALLLCTAFLGSVRLGRLLGVGTPTSRVVAGLAYALAPLVLSVLGSVSSEALPIVLLPWVLVPLVRYDRGELARWPAVARSGLAVLAMGGINASATLLVLPLPLIFVLTRALARRRDLLWRWLVAVGLGSLWWAGPLLLLGRYGYQFLGYIETARQTTANTSLVEVLRGTSHWLGYLVLDGRPVWPAAWTLVSSPALVVETAVLAGLGLAGIARRDCPERRFLVLGAVVGLLLLSAGHLGPLTGPEAGTVHGLLDGVLAPFRNVHKADAVLRLPLALGLAHLAGRLPGDVRVPSLRRLAWVAVPLLVLGTAAPLLAGLLPARGTFTAIPRPWLQASAWLDAHDAAGRALVVPGAATGAYLWGQPRDDLLQALGSTAWTVRDAVPLGSAGTTRLMDAWGAVIDSGAGSPGLATSLARAGISYIVVRNDLDPGVTDAPLPERVRTALALSPGLTEVVAFGSRDGPGVDAGEPSTALFGLGTRADAFPEVEVYRVDPPAATVVAQPLTGLVTVSGGPEAMLSLAAAGVLPSGPVVLDGDMTPRAAATLRDLGLASVPRIATDTLRNRGLDFGAARDGYGPTVAADAADTADGLPTDVLPFQGDGFRTTAVLEGAASVTASSSAADGGQPRLYDPSAGPAAAFDGDPATAWTSGATGSAVGQALRLRLVSPLRPSTVSVDVRADDDLQARVRQLTISDDVGSVTVAVPVDGGRVVATLPAGLTSTLTVAVTQADVLGPDPRVRIAEVDVDRVRLSSWLQLPTDVPPGATPGAPAAIVLSQAPGARSDCLLQAGNWLCVPGSARGTEDGTTWRRLVDLGSGSTYAVSGTALAMPGTALDGLLRQGRVVTGDASSTLTDDPAVQGDAAEDGDPSTSWVSGTADATPSLTLRWAQMRSIDRLTLVAPSPGLHVARPTRVEVVAGGVRTRVATGPDGVVRFPAVTTDSLELRVLARTPGTTVLPSPDEVALPVGIAEVRLPGLSPQASVLDSVVSAPCGQGPVLTIGRTRLETAVSGPERSLLTGVPVPFTVCGGTVAADPGQLRVVAAGSPTFVAACVVLADGSVSGPAAAGRSIERGAWSSTLRTMRVGPGAAAVLSVPENANAGWAATLDGRPLESLRLDGWQQGYLLPAGAGGTVVLRFAPDTAFRWVLVLGAAAALALCVVAVRRTTHGMAPATEAAVEATPTPDPENRPLVPAVGAAVVLAAVALFLLGGLGGLAVGGAAALVTFRRPDRAPWLVAAAMAMAGVLVAIGGGVARQAALSSPPQALCLAALGSLLGTFLPARLPEAVAGALDDRPARRGESRAERDRERQDQPEHAREGLDVEHAQHQVEGNQVP